MKGEENKMQKIYAEKLLNNLQVDVYPITLVKFLLNKQRIISYFKKATNEKLDVPKYIIDSSTCEVCKQRENMLCRQHTSIQRVLNANYVAFDLDTNLYLYKNEIFRIVGKRLVIVYCPHTKLINGEITDSKVRKVIPITVEDDSLKELPKYQHVKDFISSELLDYHITCWFNHEFSIVTIPKDRTGQDWCLITNN